jgi:hypothetical protein
VDWPNAAVDGMTRANKAALMDSAETWRMNRIDAIIVMSVAE